MSEALDILHACAAERGVGETEEWLRRVDSPSLVSMPLEQHFPDFPVEGLMQRTMARPLTRRQRAAVPFATSAASPH